jgi:ElaB/YqjD/DUF883 family membrane-anchored ribosome-binding protein
MVESTGSGMSPTRETEAFRDPQRSREPSERPSSPGYQAPADAGGALNKVKQKASEWSGAVADKAKDLVDEGKQLAQKSKESVTEWAHTAGEKAEDARTAVGEGMERFGSGIREKGSSASAVVGGRLEAAGAYLREHDFASMNESIKDVVRRHPVQSVLVGIGLGFVLAKATRRS